MKKFFNLRLSIYLAISLVLGICSAYLLLVKDTLFFIALIALFVAFVVVCVFINIRDKGGKIKCAISAICLLAFLSGGLVFGNRVISYQNANLGNHQALIRGRVIEFVDTDTGCQLVIDSPYCSINDQNLDYNVFVYVDGSAKVDIGDIVQYTAQLTDRELYFDGNFSAEYLSGDIKYYSTVSAEDIEIVGNSPTIFQRVNLFIKNSLAQGLEEQEFALAYGLLTGNAEYMDFQTITSFRNAGVAHIFAVSGLHIGFLATSLSFLLSKLKVKKSIKACIIIPVLFFYAGVCGFSSSSIRASIMCAVMLLSRIMGEKYDGISSMGTAGVIILLYNPAELFCVGFQLSFATVMGILLLANKIADAIKFLPRKIAQALGVTISALLMSIPISLNAFNQFSIIAIVANLIFVPIVGIIYNAFIICALIGGIFNISGVTLFLLNYVAKGLIYAINLFDYSIFLIGGICLGGFTICYYISVILPSNIIRLSKALTIILSLIFATVCVFGSIFLSIKKNSETVMHVTATNDLACTVLQAEDKNVLIVSYAERGFSTYAISRLKSKKGIDKIDTVIFCDYNDSADAHNVITGLSCVFELKNVYYYGNVNEQVEVAVKASFPHIDIVATTKSIRVDDATFSFDKRGCAVKMEVQNKTAVIFAKLGGQYVAVSDFGRDCDYLVTYDYHEKLFAEFKAQSIVSYTPVKDRVSAQNAGNLAYVFN